MKNTIFKERRDRLFQSMQNNSIAILVAAPELMRTHDSIFTYRQDSDFYYLTGLVEADCVAVFTKSGNEEKFYLFSREHDPVQAKWIGEFVGQERAITEIGADEAYPIALLQETLLPLLKNKPCLYYIYGRYHGFDRKLNGWFQSLRAQPRAAITIPNTIINLESIVHEMRLFKTEDEIQLMQKSVDICSNAQMRAMRACKPGMFEYELEAEIRYEFVRNNASAVSFDPIIATAGNACTLHYIQNQAQLKAGNLVLVDVGCEYRHYASDLTRTFPVDGKFSPEQKAIYEIVLAAQVAAIDTMRPGRRWSDVQQVAIRVITEGLHDLGILQGNVNALIEEKAYRRFYMHNIGHWIGMDDHDVGAYYVDGDWRKFEPGIVMSAEPGIYIAADEPGVDEKWWNIGVRIEDDVLVTPEGPRILNPDTPKTVADIEVYMNS